MRQSGRFGSRRWPAAWLGCLLFLAMAVPAVAAESGPAPAPTEPLVAEPVGDHVLVELLPGADPDEIPGEARPAGVPGWVRVPVPPGRTPHDLIKRLARAPGVGSAEADRVLGLYAPRTRLPDDFSTYATNDPLSHYQWNFGVVQAEQAWERSTGAGTRVAVVDTGVSRGDDLSCRPFTTGFNAIRDRTGRSVARDANGHGTHVAGAVAQCTNNGTGVAGLAHRATIMPVKVLDRRGQGTASDIAQGITWARRRGADVVNLSLGAGCRAAYPRCSVPIINDALRAAANADVVVVAASGNQDKPFVGTPANHPAAIAVGAVDYDLRRASYSNYGRALDLVAPGGDRGYGDYRDGILQQTLGAACLSPSRYDYCLFEGTSMSTPHVAAAAAILRSYRPSASRVGIQRALQRGALDRGPAGRDPRYGSGVLRIDRALGAMP